MNKISRRRAVVGIGAAAAAAVARPRSAKAAEELTVWWSQGYYEAENKAIIDNFAAWEKQTGTKVNLTIINSPDIVTKLTAAVQVGDVPDLVHPITLSAFLASRLAWDDKLEDLTDVIESEKAEFHHIAILGSRYYNAKLQKHSHYTVPIKCSTLMEQAWRPMIEEVGFTDADIPKTHDAYFDFFQTVHEKLRAKGKRVYGLGYSMAAKEADANTLFHHFLVAYGGKDIVLPSGQLNIDDPAIRKAAVTSLERLTTPYKKGFVPPGAINWGDVDNNNAFFARQIVMTPNATISIAVAQMEKADQYYKQIITHGIPLGNDGKPVPSLLGVQPVLIPKGAKNVDGAKNFLRGFIRPASLNQYLKEARGRWLPVMMSNIESDPYWRDRSDPHRPIAVDTGLIKPSIPWWMSYNPAYAAVLSEQLWPQAEANVTQKNMTPEQAAEIAINGVKTIFDRFKIG
jgi:multiple sugar transport system substrate-binding protein